MIELAMPLISQEECFARFQLLGRNSSHFVWFLTELEYYETKNAWVFGFRKFGKITLLALEPLVQTPTPEGFREAWNEFRTEVKPEISAFISVYTPFAKLLAAEGFQTIKVGEEPWTDLQNCIPTGKSGKGVRAGRNQALRAGFKVVEWKAEEIRGDEHKRQQLEKILKSWKSARPIDLSGFLNVVNPFLKMESRRYFIMLSPLGEVMAYLVASPVPGIQGYFMEDMVLGQHPPRGIGELLTLEALVALGESGAREASLGVVSMTTVDSNSAVGVPELIKHLIITVPSFMGRVMGVQGLHTFRKRFKPHRWENIHLAVENNSNISDTRAWFAVLFTMLKAWRPRLQISPQMVFRKLIAPIQDYPLTIFYAIITFSIFYGLNDKAGNLPDWALQKFGFYGSAPIREWPIRSIVSDLLYFDREHFWGVNSALLLLLFFTERRFRLAFIIPLVALVSIFDDPLHFLCVIKPFEFFHPELFERLIAYKDVGSSLLVALLVGFHLQIFRRGASILFATMVIGGMLELVFVNERHYAVVLNINHYFFFCLGFIIGKLKMEYDGYREREVSRKVAKAKAPVSKSVRRETQQEL